MYIWLHIAIYSHIYSVYTPKWCERRLPNTITARKLMCATPSCRVVDEVCA